MRIEKLGPPKAPVLKSALHVRGAPVVVVVGSAALLAGAVLPVVPLIVQILVLAAVAIAASAWPVRTWARTASSAGDPVALRGVEGGSSRGAFQLARTLSYFALATLGLVMLRPTPSVPLSEWFFRAAFIAAIMESVARRGEIGVRLSMPIMAGAALFGVGSALSFLNAPDV